MMKLNKLGMKLVLGIAAVSAFATATTIAAPTGINNVSVVKAAAKKSKPATTGTFKSVMARHGLKSYGGNQYGQVWGSKSKGYYSYEDAYWQKKNVTVSVMSYPGGGVANKERTGIVRKQLSQAVNAINACGANIHLQIVGDVSKKADIKIYYVTHSHPGQLTDCVGIAWGGYLPDTSEMLEQKIQLFYYEPAYADETSASIAEHELGHAIGLDHSDSVDSKNHSNECFCFR